MPVNFVADSSKSLKIKLLSSGKKDPKINGEICPEKFLIPCGIDGFSLKHAESILSPKIEQLNAVQL